MNNKLLNKRNREVRQHRAGNSKSGNPSIPYSIRIEPSAFGLETKYIDTSFAIATISAAGSVTTFAMPPQGSTATTRVGDRAKIDRIELSAQWSVPLTGQPDVVRWIVFQEKGLVSSSPTAATVLTQANPISPYMYNVRELYDILHDEEISLAPSSDSSSVVRRLAIKPRIPDLRFLVNSATPYSGQVWMLQIVYNNTNVTANHIHRMWFTDAN